jgi:FkbM family methyltransferase
LISYAQNFEDVMLARAFRGRKNGFYVDVGAGDPVNLSVTKWFYDLGWSGINIEPNKKLFERLAANRPRDLNLECGVGATASEALFLEPEIGELSTFDRQTQASARRSGMPGTTRPVTILTLTTLLKRHRKKRPIDFLKIDVEGWEHEVLKGLDLGLHRPTILVIEATIPQTRTPSHTKWEPLVVAAKYTFVYFDGVNRFYLANEHIELKKHFTSPPNVFDDFEPFALVRARADAEERLKSIGVLEALVSDSNRDRDAHLAQIHELNGLLTTSQRDGEARLSQIQELGALLTESQRDSGARLSQIQELNGLLVETQRDSEARLSQIQELGALLTESERDRDAHLAQIHELNGLLTTSQRDGEARLSQIQELGALLTESQRDSGARLSQIHELGALLTESQRDREARLSQIHELNRLLAESERESNARLDATQSLEKRLLEAERTGEARLASMQELERRLSASDRDLRSGQATIENLECDLQQVNASLKKILESRIWKITHPNLRRLFAKQDRQGPEVKLTGPDHQQLLTIAVDLTPVLPGGENGGAKVFVLELLRRLAELAPQTQFVLLTQATAHQELAALDSQNIRRLLVLGHTASHRIRSFMTSGFSRILRHLPARVRPAVGRIAYRFLSASKRSESATLLRDINADLLFCPFTAPTYAEPTTPTVSVIYDLQYKAYPEFFSAEDVVHRERTFVEACTRATMLTAISDFSRREAIEQSGLDPAKIKTVHLQISSDRLRHAGKDETVIGRLDLVARKYLIYPANFWKHKNHEMLLTAFGIARNSGLASDIKLVCTGAPGSRQQWLQQAVAGLGLAESVLFPGYLSNPGFLALMTSSAGVIFPSLYEGFGLPVVEAMAIGVPVACSNVTSLPEVAQDAAIMFDPRIPEQIAQAMVSLAQDMALRTRLIEAGTARAAEFSDSKIMAQQYWDIFQQAAGTQSNILSGVHPDGWVGRNLTLKVIPSAQARTVELEISLPEWLPIAGVTLRAIHSSGTVSDDLFLRGQNTTMSLPLSLAGGYYDMSFSPSFVPAVTGLGDDQRELCAMLLKCTISSANGELVSLFPENISE